MCVDSAAELLPQAPTPKSPFSDMWLIDTYSLELKAFDAPPARYAILSHVWTDQEVTFHEFRNLERGGDHASDSKVRSKTGFRKIEECCRLAKGQSIPYAWVDTCCIDKTSSAELSESINSMFAWYRSAVICVAYLQDVESETDTKLASGSPSRWYTRGWTLQELLAPSRVDFYNSDWKRIGSKWSMRKQISDITGISEPDLILFDRRRTSIAQKMSWASKRETTRIEDIAYCLLGIFGVHMPLLYGEGRNAFRRLQEELIKSSCDLTIFAWTHPPLLGSESRPWGMLASLPESFRNSQAIRMDDKSRLGSPRSPGFAITNAGLEIELPIIHDLTILPRCRAWNHPQEDLTEYLRAEDRIDNGLRQSHVVAILNCIDSADEYKDSIGLILTRYGDEPCFKRLVCDFLVTVPSSIHAWCNSAPLCISLDSNRLIENDPPPFRDDEDAQYSAFIFVDESISVVGYHPLGPVSRSRMRQEEGGIALTLAHGAAAILVVAIGNERFTVLFGSLWVVRCAIVAFDFQNKLDMCMNHLKRYGRVRSAQEQTWAEHVLPNVQKVVTASAVDISTSRKERVDVVYIDARTRHSQQLVAVSTPSPSWMMTRNNTQNTTLSPMPNGVMSGISGGHYTGVSVMAHDLVPVSTPGPSRIRALEDIQNPAQPPIPNGVTSGISGGQYTGAPGMAQNLVPVSTPRPFYFG